MGIWWSSAVIGGIAGGIAAYYKVMQMTREVRQHPCPRCGQILGNIKPGKRTGQQVLWGGWTCPNCRCDVDRHGNERNNAQRIVDQPEQRHTKSFAVDWLVTKRTFREIVCRPHLLLLEPQLFLIKPWLVAILFAAAGLSCGIVGGIQQGAAAGVRGVLEGCLVLGFVGFVAASVAGGVFAGVLWLVRTALRSAFHITRK